MRFLDHCNRWFCVSAVYKVRGDRGFDVTYLFTGLCPHCGKQVVGYSDFDAMGVSRTQGGASVAHKRTREGFLQLIETGLAVLVEKPSADQRPTRGSVEGVSDYTRKAAKDFNRQYVLSIDKTTRIDGDSDLLARGLHGKIKTEDTGGVTGRSSRSVRHY